MSITWKQKSHGLCPVQAWGWINDRAFYFRSRYNTSCITLATTPNKDRDPLTIIGAEDSKDTILKEYDEKYEAGYQKYEESERLIKEFAKKITRFGEK